MTEKWVKPVDQIKYHYMMGNLSLCGQIIDGIDSELTKCENVDEEYICNKCLRKLDQILSDFVETGWTP